MSLDSLTHLIVEYRYWIIIPLSFIEGPIVAFVAGTLSWLGYFNPWFMLGILLGRDVLLDSGFYGLGKFGRGSRFARRSLEKIGISEQGVSRVHDLWHAHGFRTMFFSKLSYGLSGAFLLVAGYVSFPFRTFLRYAALVALAQYGLLFVLGYFFGSVVGAHANVLETIQWVVGIIALIVTVYYVFGHRIRDRLLAEERDPDSP